MPQPRRQRGGLAVACKWGVPLKSGEKNWTGVRQVISIPARSTSQPTWLSLLQLPPLPPPLPPLQAANAGCSLRRSHYMLTSNAPLRQRERPGRRAYGASGSQLQGGVGQLPVGAPRSACMVRRCACSMRECC